MTSSVCRPVSGEYGNPPPGGCLNMSHYSPPTAVRSWPPFCVHERFPEPGHVQGSVNVMPPVGRTLPLFRPRPEWIQQPPVDFAAALGGRTSLYAGLSSALPLFHAPPVWLQRPPADRDEILRRRMAATDECSPWMRRSSETRVGCGRGGVDNVRTTSDVNGLAAMQSQSAAAAASAAFWTSLCSSRAQQLDLLSRPTERETSGFPDLYPHICHHDHPYHRRRRRHREQQQQRSPPGSPELFRPYLDDVDSQRPRRTEPESAEVTAARGRDTAAEEGGEALGRPAADDCSELRASTTSSAGVSSMSQRATRNYPCDLCEKRFLRADTLIAHRRIHTGEKPFVCDECGRPFRQEGSLTRHRLTHGIVRPHVCLTCSKAFNRASSLHVHLCRPAPCQPPTSTDSLEHPQ